MDEAQKRALIEEFTEEIVAIASELDDGSVPLEDLIQEGYVGLLRGIKELDNETDQADSASMRPVREVLTEAIREAVSGAIREEAEMRRRDDRLVVQVELLNRSIEKLTEDLGTKPNIDEIANDMGITQQNVLDILKLTGEGLSDESFIPPAGENATVNAEE
jgi:DNA-directed RNA polymerase sigma subunit (sigma70/sigma32)